MSFLIGLITRSTFGIQAMLYACAGLLIACIGLSAAVKIQGGRLDAVRAQNATLTVMVKSLGNQVTAQNSAVDQMLANAARQAERVSAAERAAAQVKEVTQERIGYVEQAAIPTACPEAVTWGAAHAIGIGKRWATGGSQ
jgi:hypothetical protein